MQHGVCLTPPEAPVEDHSSTQMLMGRHLLCDMIQKSLCIVTRTGHFAFLLHSLKIEASPKGDFGPAVDICNGWGHYGL